MGAAGLTCAFHSFVAHQFSQYEQAAPDHVRAGMAVGFAAPETGQLSCQTVGFPQGHGGFAGAVGKRMFGSQDIHALLGQSWIRGFLIGPDLGLNLIQGLLRDDRFRGLGLLGRARCFFL